MSPQETDVLVIGGGMSSTRAKSGFEQPRPSAGRPEADRLLEAVS
jgi:hypothetical protein